MRSMIIAALLALTSTAMAADGQFAQWCQQTGQTRPLPCLGAAYAAICEGPLEGTYVNNNPNFYQSWSCVGDLNWCNLHPGVPGCPKVTPH